MAVSRMVLVSIAVGVSLCAGEVVMLVDVDVCMRVAIVLVSERATEPLLSAMQSRLSVIYYPQSNI